MKRRILVISLLITTLFIFTSCTAGSYKMFMGNLKGNNTSISGNYKKFDGRYSSIVRLEKGDVVSYDVSYTTEEGNLQLLILDKNKNVIANMKNTTSVEITNDGRYYFTAKGENHSGSFDVKWDIE